jgi:hypothetical protein
LSEQPKEDALVRALKQLPRAHPPSGWQEEVLRTIDAREKEGQAAWWKGRLFRILAPALAVAAATAIALVVISPDRPPGGKLAVAMEPERGYPPKRSTSAAVGDSLRVEATLVNPDTPWDLRLYRDEELVACCQCQARDVKPSACKVHEGRVVQRWEIEQPGPFRAVLFVGDQLEMSAVGRLEDITAAEKAGVATVLTDPTDAL